MSAPCTHCRSCSLGDANAIFTPTRVTMVKQKVSYSQIRFRVCSTGKHCSISIFVSFAVFLFVFVFSLSFRFFWENPDNFHSIFILVQILLTSAAAHSGTPHVVFTTPRIAMVKTESFIFKDPFPSMFHRKTLFHFNFPFTNFVLVSVFSLCFLFSVENPESFHSIFILVQILLTFRNERPTHPLGRPLTQGQQCRLHPAPRRRGKNRKFHIHGSVSVGVPPENAIPFPISFHSIPFLFPYFRSVSVFSWKIRKFPLRFHPRSNPSHLPP